MLELVPWIEVERSFVTVTVDTLVEDVNNVHLVTLETRCQNVDAIQAKSAIVIPSVRKEFLLMDVANASVMLLALVAINALPGLST